MAVTLALAETSVIADTKAWLAGHAAVNVSVFEGERDPNAPRSETTILVKNIPFDCEEQDINALFAPYVRTQQHVLQPISKPAEQVREPGPVRPAAVSRVRDRGIRGTSGSATRVLVAGV